MTTSEQSSSFISKSTRHIAQTLLRAYDTPTSLGIFLCLKYGDDVSACSHDINPTQYNEGQESTFRGDYFAAKLLSKFEEGPDDLAALRKLAAIGKFWDCEDHLGNCNKTIRKKLSKPDSKADLDVGSVLRRARGKIASILGDLKAVFDVDNCNFGPGSSSSVPRRKAHPSKKYISHDVSRSCAPFVLMFFQDTGFDIWSGFKLNMVEHSTIQVVPKKFSSDRVIAVEPDWNIFFQKGIGAAIRKRLRLAGLDLDNGGALHEQLAKLASKFPELATIDLSSASDSISTWLVRFLLPDDWFLFLNSCRTDRIMLEDSTEAHPLRKFSSMGNGFTFELESLIFYALAISTCMEVDCAVDQVSVFGDDIILPVKAVDLLRTVFGSIGFRVNETKSFSTGYFRESCGSHFFNGWDCKPIYIRKNLSSDSEKFKVCNSIRRTAFRIFGVHYSYTSLSMAYRACRSLIHREFLIPEGYGDGGLVSSFDEATPSAVRRKDRHVRRHPNCIEGYKVKCLLPVAEKSSNNGAGMYVHKLRQTALSLGGTWKFRWSETPSGLPRWHNYQLHSWACTVSDDIDTEFCIGNDFSLASDESAYRVGHIHVPLWLDPENT